MTDAEGYKRTDDPNELLDQLLDSPQEGGRSISPRFPLAETDDVGRAQAKYGALKSQSVE